MPPKKIQTTLYEKPNIDLLRKIIASPDILDAFRTSLTAYYVKKDSKGVIPVIYRYSETLKTIGRLYADRGLQGCMREIRCALSKDTYLDIDIGNCHPTLLEQYCNTNKIVCPCLTAYVKNRELYLSHIMEQHKVSRDIAKKLMLRLSYGGGYKLNLLSDPQHPMNDGIEFDPGDMKSPYIINFHRELGGIAKQIRKIEVSISNIVIPDVTKENKNACIMSILAQCLENKCLLAMKKFFDDRFIPIGVLVFDGMMIEKCDKFNENNCSKLLKQCVNFVLDTTGYKIQLSNKPLEFDGEPTIIIPKHYPFVEDADEAQKQLFSVYGANRFKCCGGRLYVFDSETGLFSDSPDIFNKILTKNKDFLRYTKNGGKTFESYGGGSITKYNEIERMVRSTSLDDNWLERTHKSGLFNLLFRDGIYNMKTGKFTKGFDETKVFHTKIDIDFPKKNTKEIEYAMNYSFGSLCKEPDQLIIPLACALAGDVELKKIYFGLGDTNRGKSTLVKMLRSVLGQYVGYFDGGNFATDKNNKGDAAAKNRWALLKSSCRILLASEISMEDSLDGNVIKKHSSGGDTIVARVHHGLETEISPNFTCFLFVNDKPDIYPFDSAIDKRIEFIDFPFEFVSEVKDNTCQKLAVNNLTNIIASQKFKRGFLWILLDGYSQFLKNGLPKFDEIVREKWLVGVSTSTSLEYLLADNFEFKKGDDTFITPISYLNNFRKDHREFNGLSLAKFEELVTKLGGTKQAKTARVDDKVCRVWCGVKVKNTDNS
jgi:hypothetical protein